MAVASKAISGNNARLKRRATSFGIYVALGVITIFTLFPIFYMVVSSFKTSGELLRGNSLLPKEWHFENYVNMFTSVDFFVYFRNSMIICGLTTVICTGLAVFASYALARFRFPGSDFFSVAVLATQLIPGIMFLLPLYNFFVWINRTFGISLINSYQGMIGVYVAFFLPLSLWILRSFFATIPPELEEQAMVDGATRLGAFIRVILPLSGPGIVATAIYVFLTAWDELLFAWVLTTDNSVQTIPVGIRLFIGQNQSNPQYALAAATFVTIPVMVIFFFLQKQMISGLTSGAVKS